MTHLPQRVIASDIGFGLFAKAQGLRRIDGGAGGALTVDQAVQDIENMGFGRNPILKRQFDGARRTACSSWCRTGRGSRPSLCHRRAA
jgi:hypothetical protein